MNEKELKYYLFKNIKLVDLISREEFFKDFQSILLQLNEGLDFKSKDGSSPIIVFLKTNFWKENNTNKNIFFKDVFDALLENTFIINGVNNKNQTALQVALFSGNIFFAKKILEKGCDSSIKDQKGNNALIAFVNSFNKYSCYITEEDTKELIFLMDKNSNNNIFNQENKNGEDVIDVCLERNNLDILYKILNFTYDLNDKHKKDNSLLFSVVKKLSQSIESEKWGLELLEKVYDFLNYNNPGFDINKISIRGECPTVLFCAADSHVIDFLLKKGASVNIKNTKGETPLAFCLKKNFFSSDDKKLSIYSVYEKNSINGYIDSNKKTKNRSLSL